MKRLHFYLVSLTVCFLFTTSCSKDDHILDEPQPETATLSFGTVLNDVIAEKINSKQSLSDLPDCSDEEPAFVRIVLSQDGTDVVGSQAAPFRVDLAPGQDFTVEVPELELTPGQYSLDYFAVYNAAGTLIWLAPNGGIFSDYFGNPLPMSIDLGAGVKKYVEVSVMCFEDRFVNEYGYLFFELDTVEAIEFCVFGNYCDESGRHYPAAFSVDVWTYFDGAPGTQLYSNLSNTVALNDDGDYAGTTVCFALPGTDGLNEYYLEITLLNSDAYGNVTEEVIRSGVFTDQDVRDLFVGADANEYYHFREGCGGLDSHTWFADPGNGTPPVIDRDTQIYIYFDSSGSMNSTLYPLQQMRANLLKEALLPLYDNDSDLYDQKVQVVSRGSERTFSFLNIEGDTPTGNVISLVFQDEAQSVYHSGSASWDETATRTSGFNNDISVLRGRLNMFPSNAYRAVIFQVENESTTGANYKKLIQYVQNGTGNYSGDYGLSDRTEFGYVYDVMDGSTETYYKELIVDALRGLGYQL